MTYGNPKVLGVGTLAATGLALHQQLAMLAAAVILVGFAAVAIRNKWRKNKSIGE